MIRACLPVGSWYGGWGVAGYALLRELSAMTQVQYLGGPLDPRSVHEPLDFELCRSLMPPGVTPTTRPAGGRFDGPVFQSTLDNDLKPWRPDIRGDFNLGYTFFEQDLRVIQHAAAAHRNFDAMAAGCAWCAEKLREAGFPKTTVVLQGVDEQIFFPMTAARQYFRDRFVVFSGGKLELRKGQDLVIRAFSVLQQRHRDVLLVNMWTNPWRESLATMSGSPHIRMVPHRDDWGAFITALLSANGVNVAGVLTLGRYPNSTAARIYHNSDVGLFPNRCEGGTNLVLCEYMACGKPAIASFNSGHIDILTDANSIPLRTQPPVTISDKDGPCGRWNEPSLDETIERLEWAYNHRDDLNRIGRQAGQDMSKLTWRKAAAEFYALLTQQPPTQHPL